MCEIAPVPIIPTLMGKTILAGFGQGWVRQATMKANHTNEAHFCCSCNGRRCLLACLVQAFAPSQCGGGGGRPRHHERRVGEDLPVAILPAIRRRERRTGSDAEGRSAFE